MQKNFVYVRNEILLFFIFTYLSAAFCKTVNTNPLYSITAPNTLRPNSPYHVLVTIHDAPSPVDVKICLCTGKPNDDKIVPINAEETIKSEETKLITLNVGDWSQGHYKLQIIGSGGLTFNKTTGVHFKDKTFSIFIQTDKAIYKPGQIVHFRILAVNIALKPIDVENATVYIEDARRNRIKQWNGISFTNGVYNGDLQLSEQVVLGDWKIQANIKHQGMTKVFSINEYVLPTFEVKIHPPSFINYKNPKKAITIEAKYTYGKPVKGQVEVNVSDVYCKYPCVSSYIKPLTIKTLIDGKTDVVIDFVEDLSLPSWMQYGNRIAITAVVTEELTGQEQKGESEVKIYNSDYTFQFSKSDTFKPGLPFRIMLQATLQDGRPILNPITNVTIQCFSDATVLKNFTTDVPVSGEIEISFVPPEDSSSLRCEVISNDSNAYAYISKSRSLSNRYIELSIANPAVKIADEVELKITSTEEMNDPLLIVVIGRGQILHWTGIPPSNNKHHSVTIKVTPDMAPKVRVVAYYVTFCGEVISDAVDFAVDGIFKTQVDVNVDPLSVKPGSPVKVTVSTHPNAYVGLLAVDQSVLLMKTGNDVTIEQVLDDLQGYEIGERSYYTFDRRKRSSYYMRPWRPSSTTTLEMFSQVGLHFFTNGLLVDGGSPISYNRGGMEEMDSVAYSSPVAFSESSRRRTHFVEPDRVRSFFPETFLWLNNTTGSDGTFVMTARAPDTITSYFITAFALDKEHGLGLTKAPSKFKIFQPFFVSLNLPYSVVRAEVLALQAIVFNYLDVDVEAEVTLHNEDQHFVFVELENTVELDGPQEKFMSKTVKVKSGEGISVTFLIALKKLGYIDINVVVKSSVAADAIRRKLLVKAEGTTVHFSKGLLINLKDDETFKEHVTIDFPDNLVYDSENVEVSAISDILGSTVNNLDKLLRMPYGCGEQNMVNFVPNLAIMEYLSKTNRLTKEIKDKAIRFTESGYQRQLTYKRFDGSFSVFGASDKSGSTWLTAFVVKSFLQAKKFITIDDTVVKESLDWLIRQQAQNGTFPEVGPVWSKALQGGSGQGLSLSAYVLSAILESKNHNIELQGINGTSSESIISKTLDYLEDELQYISSDYDLVITTYVLHLAESEAKDKAFEMMNRKAKSDNGFMHWSMPQVENVNSNRYYYRPPSVDVEMTAYALLTYMLRGEKTAAFPIMRWLVSKRNGLGGFESTQDTVMAIQALAKFAGELSTSAETNLHISLTSGDEKTDFHLTSENALILHKKPFPAISKLDVTATGTGVGIVQITWSYNILKAIQEPAFAVTANVTSYENTLNVQTCVTYKSEEQSNMAVIEVGVPSGYTIDKNALPAINGPENIKRVDTKNGDTVMIVYLNSIGPQVCTTAKARRVFKVAEAKPAMVEVYDYYDPLKRGEAFYVAPSLSVCELCETEQCRKKENCE